MNKFIKRHIREFLLYAAVFSFFINMLMLTLPIYMIQVFDRVITSHSAETLLMLTLAAVFALIVAWALDFLRAKLMQSAGVVLDEKLGHFALSSVLKRASQMDGKEYAQQLRDVSVLRNFLTGQSLFSLFDTPWMVFYIILIFLFHPLLGWIALVSAALLFAVAVLNEKLTRPPLQEAGAAARRSSKFIDAALRNAEAVSAMGMQPGVERHWQQMNANVIVAQVQAADKSAMMVTATKTLRQLIQVIMLSAGAWLVIQQHVTPGVMMAATLVLSRALAPVESAITSWKQFVDARESYENLSKLLSADAEQENMQLPAPEGTLKVERLVAGAPGTNRAVIKGISFDVAAGEAIGIIGPSAAGKSTLLRLLAGIWKPASGNVRLDGADIATWPRDQVGPYIGYLPQDVELFAGTISENIARLQPHQDNADAIIEAAKLAGVHEMILRLPEGYDTEIGDGGAVLSGGQRQRIGLARAVFGSPPLILLDEPNSNLDNEGEEQLARALIALKNAGKTIIMVTHKPSALGFVDKILVLRDGVIDLYGTRQEVMARVTRPNVVNLSGGQEMQQHGRKP